MFQFQILRRGSRGPDTELLQEGLRRAEYPVSVDGIFGSETEKALRSFQKAGGLQEDGIAGPITWRALTPYLTGYRKVTIHPGDTFYRLAQHYNTSVALLESANPKLDPHKLLPGTAVIVPLPFSVVPTNIRCTSLVLSLCIDGLTARYPQLKQGYLGNSAMGKPLYYLSFGQGEKQVFCNGSHHGNEWITSLLLLRFIEEYARSYASKSEFVANSSASLFNSATIWLCPMVNPDGVDLATERLTSGKEYENALRMAENYPAVPFPKGWKANIRGIDPNLQYPAGWENAKRIKYALGYTSPGPRDYVGSTPLSAPESKAVYLFTLSHDFNITVSFHSQGQVIYWQYLDYRPAGALELARTFSAVSGYAVENVPPQSAYAGYKDWFIEKYDRPGYTVEVGKGTSPLPLTQFPEIYRANRNIIIEAMKS